MNSRIPIGQILVTEGHIDAWQLQSALAHQHKWGGRIGEAIVRLGFMTEHALLSEVARQLGVPYVVIGDRPIPPAVIQMVPEKLVRARRLFPIAYAHGMRRGLIVVATSEPGNLTALDEVAFATGVVVKPTLAGSRDIDQAIARHFGGNDRPLGKLNRSRAA